MICYNAFIWPNQIFFIPLWPNKDKYDRTEKRNRTPSGGYRKAQGFVNDFWDTIWDIK